MNKLIEQKRKKNTQELIEHCRLRLHILIIELSQEKRSFIFIIDFHIKTNSIHSIQFSYLCRWY